MHPTGRSTIWRGSLYLATRSMGNQGPQTEPHLPTECRAIVAISTTAHLPSAISRSTKHQHHLTEPNESVRT